MLGSNSRRWIVSEESPFSKQDFKNILSSYGSRLGKVAVILIFLISALKSFAQTVTIGTGTTTSSTATTPYSTYYHDGRHSYIYRAT